MVKPTTALHPRPSDTGVEMPTIGLGWLRGTVRGHHEPVMTLLSGFFGPVSNRPGGIPWYRSSAQLLDGRVTVGWDGLGGAAGTVMLDVRQQALDHLGWESSLMLAAALDLLGFKPSRIDVWMDDHARLADPADVRAALVRGDVVTHAQGHEWQENSRGGATAYIGSRSSERYLRVYRTAPVHGYEATRWELESKGDAAGDALRLLLAGQTTGDQPMHAVAGLIIAFVDFRARAGSEHGARAPRLVWWAALVGTLAGIRGEVAKRVDDFGRRVGWLMRQVAPTLAAVWARPEYGNGWLNGLLDDGLGRAGGYAWARS